MNFLSKKQESPAAYVAGEWDQHLYEALTFQANRMSGPDLTFFGSINSRTQEIGLYRAADDVRYVGNFRLWINKDEYSDIKIVLAFIPKTEYTDDPALQGFYAGVFRFSTTTSEEGYSRPSIELLIHDVDDLPARIAKLYFENKVVHRPDIEISWQADMKGFFRRSAEDVWGSGTSHTETKPPIGRRDFPIFSLRLAAAS